MVFLSVVILLAFFPAVNRAHATNVIEPVNLALNESGEGKPSIEASATCPCQDSASKTINGVYDFSGGSHDRWTNWATGNSVDSLILEFASAIPFNQVKLYLFNDGGDNGIGGVQLPSNYNIQYWNGNGWVDVINQIKTPTMPTAALNSVATPANTLNTVDFNTVASQKIKIEFTRDSARNSFVGVVELEVYNIAPVIPLVSYYSAFSNEAGNSVTLDVYNQLDVAYEIDPSKFKVYNGETLYSTISNVSQNAYDNTIKLTLATPLEEDINANYQVRLLNGAFRTTQGELSASINNIPVVQVGELNFNDDPRIGIEDIVYLLSSNSPLRDINNSHHIDNTDFQILLRQITPIIALP